MIPREDERLEIQFDEWDTRVCLCARHSARHVPVFGAGHEPRGCRSVSRDWCTSVARRVGRGLDPAVSGPRALSLKHAVQAAIDWETVTPLDEIPRSSIPNRVKRGIRWWKLKRAGAVLMTVPGDSARSTKRPSTSEWLEAHCRGRFAPGDVILHAPSFAFQAPGGGENQLIQTGRHLEELGVPVRLFSRVDRPARRGPAASSLRDVARGARARPGGQGAGDSGRSLADLLVRAARDGGTRARPGPARSRAWRAGGCGRSRLELRAGDLKLLQDGRRRPAEFPVRGELSSCVSSG